MAGWDATFPQRLRPHPRGVRGKAESADRGDEGRDCGSKAAEGFGRGRWKPTGGEGDPARKSGKVTISMCAELSARMETYF